MDDFHLEPQFHENQHAILFAHKYNNVDMKPTIRGTFEASTNAACTCEAAESAAPFSAWLPTQPLLLWLAPLLLPALTLLSVEHFNDPTTFTPLGTRQ